MNVTPRKYRQAMRWTLSEFLNLIELRSQCWCLVDIGKGGGFNIPHSENLLFYACLQGEVRLDGLVEGATTIKAGEVVMILKGDAHAIRSHQQDTTEVMDFLYRREYVDTPPRFKFGENKSAELLCGCLMVRWPAGERPKILPSILRASSLSSLTSLQSMVASAHQEGASAVFTSAASLFFKAAFRSQPECQQLFSESNKHDPVARARHLMETHPFHDWTVEILANKVGMSRSGFASHFSIDNGITPIEYLAKLRMSHALELLKKTDMKVSAIGDYVGYRSEAAFSRRFQKHFGQSPGKMRRSLQAEFNAEKSSSPNDFTLHAVGA